MKVLFVCAQNVLRSQAAKALFNKYAPADSRAESAGTNVERPGETIAERAAYSDGAANIMKSLRSEDVDISQEVRTPITEEMLEGYDRIVVMAEPETVPLYLSAHKKYEYWHVEDPRFKGYDETVKTHQLIKDKVLKLIEEIR